jgi:hypothetical protein
MTLWPGCWRNRQCDTAFALCSFLHDNGINAAFQRAASLELLRRTIWLGSARKDLALMKDPKETGAISLPDFISLLDETARTKSVERYFLHQVSG